MDEESSRPDEVRARGGTAGRRRHSGPNLTKFHSRGVVRDPEMPAKMKRHPCQNSSADPRLTPISRPYLPNSSADPNAAYLSALRRAEGPASRKPRASEGRASPWVTRPTPQLQRSESRSAFSRRNCPKEVLTKRHSGLVRNINPNQLTLDKPTFAGGFFG